MGNSWIEDYGDRYFMDYDMEALKRDQCYLSIENKDYEKLYLYSKYDDCVKCPFTFNEIIFKNLPKTLILDTKFPKHYRFLTKNVKFSPENLYSDVVGPITFGYDYAEFGFYKASFNNNTYDFTTLKQPVDIYLPMLTVFLIYLCLFSLIPIGRFLWKHLKFERLDLPFIPKDKNKSNAKRVQSLDTFRGLSIVLMIFVNYGHGGYAFLEHAVWNGIYVGDLVFPSFLWIMGVCIPISVKSHFNKEHARRSDAIKNVTKRSIKLFALGLFLGGGPYLNTIRIFGVLQRFAISYFVVASVNILAHQNINELKNSQRHILDLIKLKLQWIIMLIIVLVHCLLTFCLKVPNCPTGYLGPGGLHDDQKYSKCTGGAAGYIDEVILGKHIYQYAYITQIYKSKPFDPEGILGCLTTIFHVFLGVQAGTIIVLYKNHSQRLTRWIIWGLITGAIGAALCGFSRDDGVIPMNKNLWSLSFVLVTSCFAYILFSLCYIIIDVLKIWTGKPFLFAGMNAILMYVGHNMTYGNYFPIHWYLSAKEAEATHFITLLENVWATSFWVLVSYYLMKIKYFWTL